MKLLVEVNLQRTEGRHASAEEVATALVDYLEEATDLEVDTEAEEPSVYEVSAAAVRP